MLRGKSQRSCRQKEWIIGKEAPGEVERSSMLIMSSEVSFNGKKEILSFDSWQEEHYLWVQ